MLGWVRINSPISYCFFTVWVICTKQMPALYILWCRFLKFIFHIPTHTHFAVRFICCMSVIILWGRPSYILVWSSVIGYSVICSIKEPSYDILVGSMCCMLLSDDLWVSISHTIWEVYVCNGMRLCEDLPRTSCELCGGTWSTAAAGQPGCSPFCTSPERGRYTL